ncbi:MULTISPECIES: peptidylprolyl isomerase [unclassified Lysobacter]|jgi:peptidyl-prolyl cis-trans isomerase SurA|uniref:peptidylprolyl isomerase n=1 Tax=unclassified Lysobacter TaxID=2635362 RepID=UPI001BE6656B|nr:MULTISPECIES: peptidylprolyl isomerase [unclassified Lysobacter]MBT2745914.1 peptidylprolyl isomerase [Lysobacter sp. ISL-42]MBT2749527.1 peptidylprolyl isomerase [Lysobacter sp. ISL-50]MBT2778829.1 peptidylprolyl isomerase [Lysobacter sp. ISL-54]MBT2781425.1 peptidylprolyl isomerase [Lysobacter sp. ISL-52]
MNKRFASPLFAGFLAAGLLLSSVHAQDKQPIDRIAAVVDEDVILKTELDRAVANILTQYAGRSEQLPPRDVLERQVLERLILLKIQVAQAQGTGVRVTDQEVDQAIGSIAQSNKLSIDQLRQQLARDGSSYTDFRTSIRDELLVQRLRQRFAQTRVSVSDAEIDAALKAQANTGTQYHLAHILIALPEGATPEQITTAQKKVDGVKTLIAKGEMDFNAAAVRYSDSPNALEGGDLGWRSLDEIPAAFGEMMKSMKAGEVTDPIRGPSGFQLLKLVEVRDASQSGPQMVTQYHARHVLVRINDTTTEAQAKAKAETLRARIAGGAKFEDVVKESSEDLGTQGKGGDLGWFTQDEFGPEFGGAVAALTDNEVSQPIHTTAGYHIVQRLGTRQSDVADQSKRAQVQETIGRRKLEEEWNRFLREKRGEAYVDFRVGKAADASQPGTETTVPAKPAGG